MQKIHPESVDCSNLPAFSELFRDDALRLETRRLWLRWPSVRDTEALHEIASLEAVARQTATSDSKIGPHPLPGGEAVELIAQARALNAAGSSLRLALTCRSQPDRLIGLVGVDRVAESDVLVLGYLLGVEHQGYGLMTEAVRAVVNAVFRYSSFTIIRGAASEANHASRRVMEKAGLRVTRQSSHPAAARGATVTCDELELVRADWRMRPCIAARLPSGQRAIEIPCDRAA